MFAEWQDVDATSWLSSGETSGTRGVLSSVQAQLRGSANGLDIGHAS